MSKKISALVFVVLLSIYAQANAIVAVALKPGGRNYVGADLPVEGVVWRDGIDGTFTVSKDANLGLILDFSGAQEWLFKIAAPHRIATDTNVGPRRLEERFYDYALRYPSPKDDHPSLLVSGAGRSYDEVYGWINVDRISYNSSGDIVMLNAYFHEYDTSYYGTEYGLFGIIQINWPGPIDPASIPEPKTSILLAVGCLALLLYRSRSVRRLSAKRQGAVGR